MFVFIENKHVYSQAFMTCGAFVEQSPASMSSAIGTCDRDRKQSKKSFGQILRIYKNCLLLIFWVEIIFFVIPYLSKSWKIELDFRILAC